MKSPLLDSGLTGSMSALSLFIIPGVNLLCPAIVFMVLALPHLSFDDISTGNIVASVAFLLNAAVQVGGRKERLKTVERDVKELKTLISTRAELDDRRWAEFRNDEKDRSDLLHSWQEGVLKAQQYQEQIFRTMGLEVETLKTQLRILQEMPRRRGN